MRRRSTTDPFTDLLFNALLGVTFLFLISVMLINPITQLGKVNLKAEYIITVTWPENVADDLDVWVEDPNGEKLSYLNKDVGWLHLDRDDRGDATDTVTINGKEVIHPINQEVVTVRGFIAGEYVVNIYYYKDRSEQPITATVKIDKVNPSLTTVFVDHLQMSHEDEEKTALRFRLAGNGDLLDINRLPKRLTPYQLEPGS